MTIVGIVGDVKQGALSQQVEAESYTPYEQVADDKLVDTVTNEFRDLKIVVRTAGDPVRSTSAVQARIHSLDRSLPITQIATMEAKLHDSTLSERFNTALLATFAAAAVILAALGIAGVLAYSIAQRVSEIGLRLALGAARFDVLKLVLIRGMKTALLGTALGLVVSFALTRVMAGILFETSPYDPWTLLAAPAFLCLVGLLSISIPAQRAAAIDPIQALRVE